MLRWPQTNRLVKQDPEVRRPRGLGGERKQRGALAFGDYGTEWFADECVWVLVNLTSRMLMNIWLANGTVSRLLEDDIIVFVRFNVKEREFKFT